MQKIWHSIQQYYFAIGKNFHVDPVIFLGIHIIATPLFLLSIAWLIKNYRQQKSVVIPTIVSAFIFSAANIYLVIFGKNIPWWIYLILAATTIISGYFSYRKVDRKIKTI